MRLLPIIAMLAMPIGQAQAANYSIEPSDSSIGFTAVQAGEAFDGTFPNYTANITFDPEDLWNSSIQLDVHVGSVRVEGEDRQAEISGPEWLDVTRFAKASFASNDIEETDNGDYIAEGTLQIRGISKEIEVPFALEPRGKDYYAKGSFIINRRDFFVGTGDWKEDTWVAFPVTVHFDLLCIRESSTTSTHGDLQSEANS